ncbi:MAG: ArsR/SmtB family transcription factor [Casimicrobiaceae bacterium]
MHELDPLFDKVARYFALLSDPSRLKIIHAICNEERSVNAVAEATGLSQPTASRHLSALFMTGSATRRRDGNQVFYKIADKTLTDICRTACVSLVARADEATNANLVEHSARFMAAPRVGAAAPTRRIANAEVVVK